MSKVHAKSRWVILVTALIASACLAAGILVAPGGSAEAASNPGKIVWNIKVDGKDRMLRYGTSKWGYLHIKRGGTHGHTFNHELTTAAKNKWAQALNGSNRYEAKNGLTVFATSYIVGKKTKNPEHRTMCVVYNFNKVKYGNSKKKVQAGIVTAFWKEGSWDANQCN